MRTQQLPLTKQDSYANAIYNSATRAQQARKGLRKQGIYKEYFLRPSKNDFTHLGGGGICQKVTLLHKPIL